MERYSEVLLFIAAFELLFFGILLLIRKTSEPHFKWLGLFLLTKGLCVGSSLLNMFYPQWFPEVPFLYLTGFYLAMTFGPLLYLFVRSLSTRQKARWTDAIHFVPFILAFAYFAITLLPKSTAEQVTIISQVGPLPGIKYYWGYWGFFYLFSIGYIVAAWEKIRLFNIRVKNQYSSLTKSRLSWLYPVLLAFTIVLVLDAMIMNIPWIYSALAIYKIPILETIFVLFAQLFIYVGLTQPVFHSALSSEESKRKYFSSKLTLLDKREMIQTIRVSMRNNHLYLDPELSIEKLATISGLSTRNISQVINEIANQNFYDFVNTYRIEEAKTQLANPENSSKTVLEILYAVGFNSKSVFNAIFKKKTGVTPTQYRRMKLEESRIG